MKRVFLIVIILLLAGCGSVPKAPFDLLVGYDYAIANNEFYKITGDFYELKYNQELHLKMGAGYTTRDYKYGQVLYLMIRTLKVHDFNTTDYNVKVQSKNIGELALAENTFDHPTLTYTIPLNFATKEEVLAALKGDEITAIVNDKIYRFVSPK